MKKCWKCKRRPATQKNGFCRPCRAAYARKYRKENREKDRDYLRAYRKAHPEKTANWTRNARLKKEYGITLEDFARMRFQQNNQCACCGDKMRLPHIDHDHETGKVRELLCRACNIGLGHFKEEPARLLLAIAYLFKHNKPTK